MPKVRCIRGHILSDKDIRVDKQRPASKNRVCKKCLAITNKRWRQKNPNYCRNWRLENPDHYKPKKARNYRLKKKYGIDIAEYERLFEKQQGSCATCGNTPDGRWGKFMVDHNHSTGQVRGLLCLKCNRAIGLVKDDIEILERMVRYLKKGREHGKTDRQPDEASDQKNQA